MNAIHNIAEICAKKGIQDVILSPGSRCAPLTIAFARHSQIQEKTISDERVAGFIALGMAQYTGKTVPLICTSGTASLNYAPAITEAYYQHIPLLVLTADRPPEWIDQRDGQTIRQRDIYQNHIKGSFELPVDYSHPDAVWQINRIVSEAINLSQEEPKGPVHINIPLREPFYPTEEIIFDSDVQVIEKMEAEKDLTPTQWKSLQKEVEKFDKVLVIAGQEQKQQGLRNTLFDAQKTPIISDLISNIQSENSIHHHDLILSNVNTTQKEVLQPDLLITYGKSVISKSIKLFVREYKPKQHWHIQTEGQVADTYQCLSKIIPVTIDKFLMNISLSSKDYLNTWKEEEQKAKTHREAYFKEIPFGEFMVFDKIMNTIPEKSHLHLANSMTVRYANFFDNPKQLHIFANRGTSGIDGSTSTTVGTALTSLDTINTLITGDLSFFYDRNAFWHNYLPNNLRIIVLNNHGGGIFRMINGPASQPELEPYFETKQQLNTENTAKDFGLEYTLCEDEEDLKKAFETFFKESKNAKLLEATSEAALNTAIFRKFKKY